MDGPDVIWVTHPSFRTLDNEEELLVYNYFQSVKKSGGGQIKEYKRVRGGNNETTALLVRFCDTKCVARVCSRDHFLSVIFSAKPDKFSSKEQKLVVKTQEFDPVDIPSETKWLVVSDCGESMASGNARPDMEHSLDENMPTASIEVYDMMEDCMIEELKDHFEGEPYFAKCLSADLRKHENERTFILEFSVAEADNILSQPERLLDEEDPDSKIRIRPFRLPIKQLLVFSEKEINARFLKNSLKKGLTDLGLIESCHPRGDSKREFILTFTDAADAERLAKKTKLVLSDSVTVTMSLYEGGSSHAVGKETRIQHSGSAYSMNDLDRSDSPMSTSSLNLDTAELSKPVKMEPLNMPRKAEGYTSPQSTASNINIEQEAADPSDITYTHIEVDKLLTTSVKEMFALLELHLNEHLGNDHGMTKIQQSYDPTTNVFRFDLKPREIAKLLRTKQMLFEEESDSVLTIRPCHTGRIVEVRVVRNPRQVRLDTADLLEYFGLGSGFYCRLTVIDIQPITASLHMETCSVASLIVSVAQHTLQNQIVLKASFPSAAAALSPSISPSPDESPPQDVPNSESPNNVVLVKTELAAAILKKLMRTRSHGKLSKALGEGQYLVEYESHEDARKVVEQEVMEHKGHKINVSFYVPKPESSAGGGERDTPVPTHIEVKRHTDLTAEDMFGVLDLHFDVALGRDDWPKTQFEHSYDDVQDVFRFDLSATDIEMLTSSDQLIDDADEKSKLDIAARTTGGVVFIRATVQDPAKRLSKTALKACFGLSSPFASRTLAFSKFSDFSTEIKLPSCSVASLTVSKRRHTLKNGLVVEACFPEDQHRLDDSDAHGPRDPRKGRDVRDGSGTRDSRDPTRGRGDTRGAREARAHGRDDDADTMQYSSRGAESDLQLFEDKPGPLVSWSDDSLNTLLVSNLLDVDEQTIYFWIKALLNTWPRSVQISADEEKAIVKIPSSAELDKNRLQGLLSNVDYHIHDERLSVVEVPPTTQIHVICSGPAIDRDQVVAYFSNARFTGLADPSAFRDVQLKQMRDNQPIFIVTYSSPQDVNRILTRKPHKYSKWTFDVAEYYKDIGLCTVNSLYLYQAPPEADRAEKQSPTLYIKNPIKNESDLQTLELFMSNRKRTGGGDIASWIRDPTKPGVIKLVYQDPTVAERVYACHSSKGLTFDGQPLDIELELPSLADCHDDHKVRISGLNEALDPEKLKFYLSALSSNVVSEIFFNVEQTRAVALFRHALDYGKLLYNYHQAPFKDYDDLKIQQQEKAKKLIATGNLAKESVEMKLELILKAKFGREMEVTADQHPKVSDTWTITTEHDALAFLLNQKRSIPECKTLQVYYEHLGLHATCGVQKKTQDLSNFISDPAMLKFVMTVKSGFQKLANYMATLGLMLAQDGAITVNLTTDKKRNRDILKTWRILNQTIDRFVSKHFQLYHTDALTQQVFDKTKPEIVALATGRPVILQDSTNYQGFSSAGNWIAIAGEKVDVESLKAKLIKTIRKIDADIQEERSVTQVVVPNILEYQLQYLTLIDFFNSMKQMHKLKSITGDSTKQQVAIQGRPASIEAVQKEMLGLQPKVTNSKISANKKPLFLKVFKTEFARQTIEKELLSTKITAVWSLENRTISVYSESKETSQKAMDCINHVVWEAQYPADHDLDELERKLLMSSVWKDKKAELQMMFQPLEIVELGDRPGLSMAGLMQHKPSVLEVIPYFFDQNVKRVKPYNGVPDRILFFTKFTKHIFSDLEKQHDVRFERADDSNVSIAGTKDSIANCERSLKKELDSIRKELHRISNLAMIEHISSNQEFLVTVGIVNSCLVVTHKEMVEEVVGISLGPGAAVVTYSVTLPSGTVCEVRRGDITSITCDAIVNAANGDLQHSGGLAAAIVQKGGNGIQQECSHYVRKKGTLMEGQVMSTSAGSLPCKRIIHAVGPRWTSDPHQEAEKEMTLYTCIDNCFEEADKSQIRSIAIPPISTGIFGYPLEKAVITIVEAVKERENRQDPLPRRITFIDNKDNSLRLFERELHKKFEKAMPKAAPRKRAQAQPSPKTPTTVSSGKLSISGKSITVLQRTKIEIVKGDLSDAQEESLVNSVGSDLNLGNGRVAQAIAAKAGPQLQTACSAVAPIKAGEVKQTDGFNLGCDKVLHCCCPQWSGPQSLQDVKQIVIECLTQAAANGHQSIAFPALGTGNLRYPESDVAQYMIEAVTEYVEKNANSSITTVKIVVFHLDMKTQKGFNDELRRLTGTSPPKLDLTPVNEPSSSIDDLDLPGNMSGVASEEKMYTAGKGSLDTAVKGSVQVNNTTIRVVEGSITDHKADALVNSTDGWLNIQGQVSRALLAAAGDSVRSEVSGLAKTRSSDGLWVSGAGNLAARCIFHVDAQSCNSPDDWSRLIANCLANCDIQEIQSIAFPALGTGNLGIAAKDMATIILKTVIKYLNDHKRSWLQRIDVVIFQPEMVKDFTLSMSKAIQKKESFFNRFAVKISEWIFGYGSYGGDSTPHAQSRGAGGARNLLSSDAAGYTPALGAERSSPEQGVLLLDIYASKNEDIKQCKKDLESRLDKLMHTLKWSDKPTYKEDREHIGKLSQSQIRKLRMEAERRHVQLDIDQKLLNIKIVGLHKAVYEMSDSVAVELKNIEKDLVEKNEEKLIALARQWEYMDHDEKWSKFDPTTNKTLEGTYKKNDKAVHQYDTKNGKVKLDMSKMKGTHSSRTFEIRRLDLSKPQATALPLPSTWKSPVDQYGEFALVPGTPEYNLVERNFLKTLGTGGNAVLEVKRVQNPTLYQQYLLLRKDVANKLKKKEDQVETSPLWHGTNEDTVLKITNGKFDRGLSGKNATMYGNGSYFATDSSYSARPQYSQPNASGHRYMIQTRVITGEWTTGAQGIKAAPYKNQIQTEQYDSVVDNPAAPSIFVVFHDASAYPEYIIKFQ